MVTDTNINITKKRSIGENKIIIPKKTKTTNRKSYTVKNVFFHVVKKSNQNIYIIRYLYCYRFVSL